jgi:hypothetical protein
MNSISISVACDRKAALLAGRVLGERVNIEVSPEIIGEHWPRLVGLLDMSSDPARLRDITVTDTDPAQIVAALAALAAAHRERLEREQAELAAYEQSVIAAEIALSSPMQSQKMYAVWGQVNNPDPTGYSALSQPDHPFAFDGFARALPEISNCWGLLVEHYAAKSALDARTHAVCDANQAAVRAANDAALAENLPRLREIKAQRDAEAAEKEAAEKAAKAEANKAKFAARLETGYWERETGSYNERRYSAQWCASVTFNGSKPVYEWGESSGKWGKSGLLRAACKPGDFIAWGQKDLRRPDKSENNILRMRADGSMESFSNATEAYKAWRETATAKT